MLLCVVLCVMGIISTNKDDKTFQYNLSAYDKSVLADKHLVLYLRLDGGNEPAVDLSGHDHTGTPHNGPSRTTFLNGDGATVFNGVDQFIQVPDHDSLSVNYTGVLTIEAWIRPDVLNFPHPESPSKPWVYWAGKVGPSADEYACRMYCRDAIWTDEPRPNWISGYAFNLIRKEGAETNLGSGSRFNETVMAGEWIYYVLVINTINTSPKYPTGYTKIYRNGLKKDQDPLKQKPGSRIPDIVPGNGIAPLRIGTGTANASFFQGAVAKMAIYDYELSNTTVMAHYQLIVPPSPSPRMEL